MANRPPVVAGMVQYDQDALNAIWAWKNPEIGWFDKAMEVVNRPLDAAGDVVMNAPGVGPVMQSAVSGAMSIANDVAQWSVRPEAIYEEFRGDGHTQVRGPADIERLGLEKIDRVVGYLAAKYKGIALVEGGAAGLTGLPGIPPDIAALLVLNLRAIGEYATYYGFDITSQHERLYAMNVLALASSPNQASKGFAMAQLVRIANDVARKAAWKDLEKHLFVRLIRQIAKVLGVRLTKAKLAQIVPMAGAAVGGGFNAYFTNQVCDAAYMLYRERHLARRYGAIIIEQTVAPAASVSADYTE